MTLLSAVITLLLVMDPLGNVPSFLAVLRDVPPARRRPIILRESLIAFGILLLFLAVGPGLMSVLRLEEPSLSIAGGIILFLIAIKMIFPHGKGMFSDMPEGEPLVVPLATPLIAGPSAMATVLLLVTREPGRFVEWGIAVTVACAITAAVLVLCNPLHRLLGERGLMAVQRLMGMILTTIAVQMFLTGVRDFLAAG